MPLRCTKLYLMWVVVTLSIPSCHVPVENPCHLCSAYFDGCGRPSIQIVRSARPNSPDTVYAINCSVPGSTIVPMRKLGCGARIEYVTGCARPCHSGSE